MHPFILHIETSTELCSVALSRGKQCVAVKENSEGRNHATVLTSFIEELLAQQAMHAHQLAAVSFSSGPGSYTGLRIGLSVAKGLCYGGDIPLIAVSTLHAMCHGLLHQCPEIEENALLCPMIDARRMEVYTALFDIKGNMVKEISAEIITGQSFENWLNGQKIYFFGNGAAKCSDIIEHHHAQFVDNFHHSSEYLIPDALNAYLTKDFEDVAYFEPFYLKDFIAGKPKQML
ncbi:MAG: tRNA (adenosine(37)-N6)-threonylcarbamoyltransferase complex dimerization subunit type 1 TsaB [Bacteroidales bacterium]|jgi:tRNA threonylcarbamoyladenosine biosynthesis protein TsaB|nr:tRNA (adenosine(37)-N6)-threonylcarbamoyltransferase complex dimerization subunit type 1 TsaB [Bacteroidales bacterium]